MSKPARGTKRVCPSCGARFYDLSRSPIVCPVCQSAYQVAPPPTRRERAAPVEPTPAPEPETEKAAAAKVGAEVVSLEDAEASDDDAVDDEAIADLGDDAPDIPDDDDDTFLEQEEEDEGADVTGIVSGPEKEES